MKRKEYSDNKRNELFGTFQLNKEKEIHSWYPYLAGFSAEFVRKMIERYNITPIHKIFDPFAGVGTTLLVAKQNNIFSEGTEINPFAVFVSNTKLFLNHNPEELLKKKEDLLKRIKQDTYEKKNIDELPELLKRVFSQTILRKLILIKDEILKEPYEPARDLFLLALIRILKDVSNCENFSPYLEFKTIKIYDANVIEKFKIQLEKMISNVTAFRNNTHAVVYNNDARNLSFLNSKFDMVVTSPPYLNNWDYTWITKIELFFMGFAKNNRELTLNIRNKLIKNSTYVLQNVSNRNGLIIPDSEVKNTIIQLSYKLEYERKNKGQHAKKYDIMIKEYFSDIYIILNELYKIMADNSYSIWVVGDSALYGIHIPTDEIIGKISELIGFNYKGCEIIRSRRATRHRIDLRESIVIMEKVRK